MRSASGCRGSKEFPDRRSPHEVQPTRRHRRSWSLGVAAAGLTTLPAPRQQPRTGTMQWSDCKPEGKDDPDAVKGSQCATLQVPVDWRNPDGPTFGLAIARRTAKVPSERVGVLRVRPWWSRRLRRRPDQDRDGPVQPGPAGPVRHRQLRPARYRPQQPGEVLGRAAGQAAVADHEEPGRLRPRRSATTASSPRTAASTPARCTTTSTPGRRSATWTRSGRRSASRRSRSTAARTARCSARSTPRPTRTGSARWCWRAWSTTARRRRVTFLDAAGGRGPGLVRRVREMVRRGNDLRTARPRHPRAVGGPAGPGGSR